MKDTTLITGKTGSVGSNLNFGIGFPSSKYDLKCPIQTAKIFDEHGPFNKVVHCAASVGGIFFHLTHKYDLFYNNVAINTNIINECRKRKIPRVLSFLSSCIFSDDKKLTPYSEKDIFESPPAEIHYPYAYSKRVLSIQSKIIYEESDGNMIYNCVIPTNMFGKFDDFNLQQGHVVGMLIRKAYDSYINGSDFVVWGSGEATRNFIYFDDVAKITEWALDNYLDKEPLIISDSNPVKISDLAELIAEKFDIKKKLVFDKTKPEGQKNRELDGTKLHELTKFQFTPLKTAIGETINWFIDTYPNVRL